MSLADLSACELRAGFLRRAFSSVEVIDALAGRIAERDRELNAFTTLALEPAREEAARADREYARGGTGPRPLAGLPLAVKDIFDTAGVRTTCGSAMFANRVPTADATAVRRARAAGAIVIGKTLTHEFAWGITSDNPHFGPCRNPWARDRVAGGSSGGSAAAVAAGECPLALGSDTGGSVRIPAAFCGVVGMKPTFGRVSTAGVFPLAPSLDHIGTIARTPADALLLLEAIEGPDPLDPLTRVGAARAAISSGSAGHLSGRRVALCHDLHLVEPAPAVHRALEAAAAAASAQGAEVVEVAFPDAGAILPAFEAIQFAEALRVHRQRGLYPARAPEYGQDVRGRLEAAENVGLDEYLDARDVRLRIRAAFVDLFATIDFLLTPVSAGPPVRIGEDAVEHRGAELPFRDLVMAYTVPQDVAGLPACALRAGIDEHRLPVAVQLTGPFWADRAVLAAADALAEALD